MSLHALLRIQGTIPSFKLLYIMNEINEAADEPSISHEELIGMIEYEFTREDGDDLPHFWEATPDHTGYYELNSSQVLLLCMAGAKPIRIAVIDALAAGRL